MKKLSGWMIFWIIMIIINIITIIINYYTYKEAETDSIGTNLIPSDCLLYTIWMGKYTMNKTAVSYGTGQLVFMFAILFILYKNAPN